MTRFICTDASSTASAMLVAILVAYQAYVLAMVPWIEPTLAVRVTASQHGRCRSRPERRSVSKYQRRAGGLFSRRPLVANAAAEGDRK